MPIIDACHHSRSWPVGRRLHHSGGSLRKRGRPRRAVGADEQHAGTGGAREVASRHPRLVLHAGGPDAGQAQHEAGVGGLAAVGVEEGQHGRHGARARATLVGVPAIKEQPRGQVADRLARLISEVDRCRSEVEQRERPAFEREAARHLHVGGGCPLIAQSHGRCAFSARGVGTANCRGVQCTRTTRARASTRSVESGRAASVGDR